MPKKTISELSQKFAEIIADISQHYYEIKSKADYFENECDNKESEIHKLIKKHELTINELSNNYKNLESRYDKLCKDIVVNYGIL